MTDSEIALEAALAGAKVVRAGFGQAVTVGLKGGKEPVTEIDRAAEAAVLEVIRTHCPADGIFAEESGSSGAADGRRWLVDPLDGTVNFIHGIPHFGVSVALWDEDGPQAGVVVDVMRDEVFSAERGGGAFLGETRLRVSETDDLAAAVVVTGFPYARSPNPADHTGAIGTLLTAGVAGIRRMGAASLDFAWVAAGRFDGYWEFGLAPWDVAAGVLLVQEAGGVVSHPRGRASGIGDRGWIATNGLLHQRLRELVWEKVPEQFRNEA